MDTLVQADIFFFITSIAVVVVGALLVIALVYSIGILRDARKVMKAVKAESDMILRDVGEARAYLRKEGARLAAAAGFLGRFFKGGRSGRRSKARSENVESEE